MRQIAKNYISYFRGLQQHQDVNKKGTCSKTENISFWLKLLRFVQSYTLDNKSFHEWIARWKCERRIFCHHGYDGENASCIPDDRFIRMSRDLCRSSGEPSRNLNHPVRYLHPVQWIRISQRECHHRSFPGDTLRWTTRRRTQVQESSQKGRSRYKLSSWCW